MVNLGSQASEFPAIKRLLLFWLETAIDDISQNYGIKPLPKGLGDGTVFDNQVTARGWPIYQVKDQTKFLYVSALAFRLSKWWQWPIEDTVFALSTQLQALGKLSQADPRQDFTLEVVSPGSIYFQLSDLGVAGWLQYLIQTLPQVEFTEAIAQVKVKSNNSSVCLFPVQYAHARCCSLLRLADREGIIQNWENLTPQPPSLQGKGEQKSGEGAQKSPSPRRGGVGEGAQQSPSPRRGGVGEGSKPLIKWVDDEGKLRLVHPAERRLIWDFFWLLDSLYCPLGNHQQVDWHKLAISLSQSFEGFYSQCRIWGEVKTQAPQLAQARLGLILVTKAWLRLLLADFLGVVAPVEL